MGGDRAAGQRSLRSYLLLPRPKDAVKWWILPVAFGIGALGDGGVSGHELARAAVVWALLELLIYQARYQWNDIRGFAADQRHPDAAARGRLPGPVERGRRHVALSRLVLGGRLLTALLVAGLLRSSHLLWPTVALIAAVFGVAVLYEWIRGRATGRTDEVPPPLRPAILALWLVVGGGYAIRGVTGLALAVDVAADPVQAVAAVLAMWGYGVFFVTMRWAVEALAFARADGGSLVWTVRRDQAREHTLALVRWLPERMPSSASGGVPRWPALRGRGGAGAPWRLAVVVAGGAALVVGRTLASPAGATDVILAALAGAAFAAVVAARPEAWIAIALVLMGGLALSGVPRTPVVLLPWLVIVAAYARFAAQTLEKLAAPARLLLVLRRAAHA